MFDMSTAANQAKFNANIQKVIASNPRYAIFKDKARFEFVVALFDWLRSANVICSAKYDPADPALPVWLTIGKTAWTAEGQIAWPAKAGLAIPRVNRRAMARDLFKKSREAAVADHELAQLVAQAILVAHATMKA